MDTLGHHIQSLRWTSPTALGLWVIAPNLHGSSFLQGQCRTSKFRSVWARPLYNCSFYEFLQIRSISYCWLPLFSLRLVRDESMCNLVETVWVVRDFIPSILTRPWLPTRNSIAPSMVINWNEIPSETVSRFCLNSCCSILQNTAIIEPPVSFTSHVSSIMFQIPLYCILVWMNVRSSQLCH